MPKKLFKSEFTSGFEKKSFLGSSFPSVKAMAPRMDKVFGTELDSQFASLKPRKPAKIKRF